MSLMEQLTQDMKAAMKAKESGKVRLSVIRMVKSAAKYQEIEKGQPLDDPALLQVISRELKQRRDVLPEYEKNDRLEMVETLHQEIAVLMDYLPQQLTDEEIQVLVGEAINALGATGAKDMGKVMGKLNPAIKGKADGRRVSQLVQAALAALES